MPTRAGGDQYDALVAGALTTLRQRPVKDGSELEHELGNIVFDLVAELSDAELEALAERDPARFRDRTPDYSPGPDGEEEGIDLIERNVREQVELRVLEYLAAEQSRYDLAADGPERRFKVDLIAAVNGAVSTFVVSARSELEAGERALSFAVLAEGYDPAHGWRVHETVDVEANRNDTGEQHPLSEDGTKWMAHCVQCGTYVDDHDSPPPLDFLCDECESTDDEQ